MSFGAPGILPSAASQDQEAAAPTESAAKREDWRKAKELDEARKAGTAPALVDEEGKDINPHIPQYISTVPWYVGYNVPTLKHQRPQGEKQREFSALSEWYKKGVNKATVATRFRKGSCENCGAMTHIKKDCVERPRKVGAKFTGEKFAPDEFVQPDLSFDWDGKRDRWNGYDLDDHEAVHSEYGKIEEAKKHLKAQQMQDEMMSGEVHGNTDNRDSDDSDADEDKYADKFDMPGTNFDSKRRITVRNLRIREDTAKYLHNLDPESAYYDPKTRSMRQNPYANTGKSPEDLKFGGDNFVRASGDTNHMATAQMFAWEAFDKGTDVHLQAEPTKLEMLHKEFSVKKDDFKQNQKDSILQKYGGEKHLEAPPKQLLLAQTEDYVEYSRHGTLLKGQEKAKAKSKYEEDVFLSNHRTVWGSYWKEGRWGFRCCHSYVRGSYCTGEAGKEAASVDIMVPLISGENEDDEEEEEPKSLLEQHKETLLEERKQEERKRRKNKKKKDKKKRKRRHSTSSEEEDEEAKEAAEKAKRLKEALETQERLTKEADRILAIDERKRPYNSLKAFDNFKEPTEEEMEAYRMKRSRDMDPMAKFLTK